MKTLLKLLLIAVLVLPLFSITAKAQSTNQQIQQLKQQIQQLQQQNQQQIQQLQQQIQQLQNSNAQTDQNLAQISQKQTEAEGAWYNKFMSKYDGGFVFESKDKEGLPFKLKIGILSQIQFYVNDPNQGSTQTNFRLRRLEITFAGYAFAPWFYYHFMFDPTKSSAPVQDMYFTAAYQKEIGPRIGQWKVPFEQEELQSSSALQLVERSIVNSQFTLERDRGFAFQGVIGPHNNFSYAAGVFNGAGNNGTSVNSKMLYVGRIQLGLGGDGNDKYDADGTYATAKEYGLTPNFAKEPTIEIGAAGSYMPSLNCSVKTPNGGVCPRITQLTFGNDVDFTQVEADALFKMKYFNVVGEYDGRWLNPNNLAANPGTAYDQGFRAQAGVFLVPKTVELAARYAWIGYDTSSSVVPPGVSMPDTQWEITPGLNYYISHSHAWKVQLSYTYQKNTFTEGAPSTHANVVRAQVQANF